MMPLRGENMLKTHAILMDEYQSYADVPPLLMLLQVLSLLNLFRLPLLFTSVFWFVRFECRCFLSHPRLDYSPEGLSSLPPGRMKKAPVTGCLISLLFDYIKIPTARGAGSISSTLCYGFSAFSGLDSNFIPLLHSGNFFTSILVMSKPLEIPSENASHFTFQLFTLYK